jgi:ABC-2 type transport system ATP-binding protein
MKNKVIETYHLTRRYGKTYVVDDLNLNVYPGDIYGFLGPNGAGKTTTIRMLLGLIQPTSGDVEIFGKNLKKERISILKKVGSLVDSPSYYGHLTGRENLEVLRRLLDVPKSRIDEVLSIVRLDKSADRAVKGYSLGMKQRLGIAASLLGSPELLILDEPTNGLDPAGIQEIRELIKEMPKQYGITVVISSHLLNEIDQMATRVGVIQSGRLIFEDTIAAMRKQSQSRIKLVTDQPYEAAQILKGAGISSKLEDGILWLEDQGNAYIAKAIETLVMKRISIYRVEEVKNSLEEIFLKLVGKESSL